MKYKIRGNTREDKLKAAFNNLSPHACLSGEQRRLLKDVVRDTIQREREEKIRKRQCLDLD